MLISLPTLLFYLDNSCGWTVEEAFEREKYAQVNLGK